MEFASARRAENGGRSPRRAEGSGRDLILDDSEDDDYVPGSEDSSSDEDCDSEEDHNEEDDNYDDLHMGFGDPQQQDIVVREVENGLMGDGNTTDKPSRLEAETPSPPSDDQMQE